jgi:hypothetical protein
MTPEAAVKAVRPRQQLRARPWSEPECCPPRLRRLVRYVLTPELIPLLRSQPYDPLPGDLVGAHLLHHARRALLLRQGHRNIAQAIGIHLHGGGLLQGQA